eukprot:TRINITY_DN22259_c0_g1_i1.p1 TRINITY_DN22259_c0_g1~~TRINITY_DN22259_c0_g1_i1.p1  ORF type:complete len:104 (+),score=26.16 TRINITY_DN22259_c0_g1_i1:37-348(+)
MGQCFASERKAPKANDAKLVRLKRTQTTDEERREIVKTDVGFQELSPKANKAKSPREDAKRALGSSHIEGNNARRSPQLRYQDLDLNNISGIIDKDIREQVFS